MCPFFPQLFKHKYTNQFGVNTLLLPMGHLFLHCLLSLTQAFSLEDDLEDHLVEPFLAKTQSRKDGTAPCSGVQMPKVGETATSLKTLLQWLTVLIVKNFPLVSNWNHLRITCASALWRKGVSTFLGQEHFKYQNIIIIIIRFPLSLLFSRLYKPSSLREAFPHMAGFPVFTALSKPPTTLLCSGDQNSTEFQVWPDKHFNFDSSLILCAFNTHPDVFRVNLDYIISRSFQSTSIKELFNAA